MKTSNRPLICRQASTSLLQKLGQALPALCKLREPYSSANSASVCFVEHACARCQDQTGAMHMFYDTNESESCLVKAPAKHASESVNCCVQACKQTQRKHTGKETREMCSCWGYKQHMLEIFVASHIGKKDSEQQTSKTPSSQNNGHTHTKRKWTNKGAEQGNIIVSLSRIFRFDALNSAGCLHSFTC